MFTLPKNIYGRQSIINEIILIIGRCAILCSPSSALNESDLCDAFQPSLEIISQTDSTSTTVSSPVIDALLSTIMDEESDTSKFSSRMFNNSSKTGTIIVGLYGPAGIGISITSGLIEE